MTPKQIVIDLLTSDEVSVLNACAEWLAPKEHEIHLSPLGRYGYTGAKLFSVNFADRARGQYFVAKIAARDKIVRENQSIGIIKPYFRDANGETTAEANSSGCIVYPMVVKDEKTREITELKDIVLRWDDDAEEVVNILRATYGKNCNLAHSHDDVEERVLGKEYEWYLRSHRARKCIAHATRNYGLGDEFYGAKFSDPIRLVEKICTCRVQCKLGAVHGDLHPNNVLLDDRQEPKLIDWEWGSYPSDVLKDFVLMECSIRFLLFPASTDLLLQTKIDRALLQEYGTDELRKIASRSSLLPYYERLSKIVVCIRECARGCGGKTYSFDNYLYAQTLVLYGLLGVPSYPFHIPLAALNMMAEHILNRE